MRSMFVLLIESPAALCGTTASLVVTCKTIPHPLLKSPVNTEGSYLPCREVEN